MSKSSVARFVAGHAVRFRGYKPLIAVFCASVGLFASASMDGLCFVKKGAEPDDLGYWWFDEGTNWMIHVQYPTERAERFPTLTDNVNLNSKLLSDPATPLYIKEGDHAESKEFCVGMGRGGWSGGIQYFTMYGGTMTNKGPVNVGHSDGTSTYGLGVVDFRAGEWTVISNSVAVSRGAASNVRESNGCFTIHEGARLNLDYYKNKDSLGSIILGYGDHSYGVMTNMGYVSAARVELCPWPGVDHPGERALLVMRGGTFYTSDAVLTGRDSNFTHDSLRIGGYLGEAVLRGWGKFDRGGNKNKNKENIYIGMMCGQVIADGEGEERDLDLGWFLMVNGGKSYDLANWNGTNGWYAVNKGRLIYPHRSETTGQNINVVRGDGGENSDKVDRNYDIPSDLINTVHLKGVMKPYYTYTDGSHAYWNTWQYVQLYAEDRTDYPSLASVAPKSPRGKCLGVFRIGIFNHASNSSTNPTSRRDFESMNVKIRYDDRELRGKRDKVTLYRYDDTEGWKALATLEHDPDNPYISAENLLPRASTVTDGVTDNWNLGWFAVQSDRDPNGLKIIVR